MSLCSSPSLKVLVAEDNLLTQTVVVEMLEDMGYEVDSVLDGLGAVQALQDKAYDVIFMDVQMPNMNGLTATRQIRQISPAEQQPYIIALTGRVLPAELEECRAAGMDDFLSKPVHVVTLSQALSQYQSRANLSPLMPVIRNTIMAASTNSSPEPVLDPEALEDIRTTAGAEADRFLVTMIDTYLETAASLLPELLTAMALPPQGGITDQQWQILREKAHACKSMSGFIGAKGIAQLCQTLETLATVGTGPDAELMTRLEMEYARVKLALLKERQRAWHGNWDS